jgi:hypothetical protein
MAKRWGGGFVRAWLVVGGLWFIMAPFMLWGSATHSRVESALG